MVRFFVRSPCPVLFPSWKQPLQPYFSWKARRNRALNMEGKGVKVEEREKERWEIPPVNRSEAHKPCVRKETACGAGSSG